MTDDKNCAVLINSCDGYQDLWYPFFSLFYRFWPNCRYRVFLNAEHIPLVDGFPEVEVKNQKESEPIPWGKRMRECLEEIEENYVIILLDDFFLRKAVDSDKIAKCLDWLDSDPSTAVFYFQDTSEAFRREFIDDGRYSGFETAKKGAHYLMNLQAAVWRKSDLLNSLHDYDTPWTFEVLASRYYSGMQKFRYLKPEEPRIIDYGFQMKGMGVFRGKWVESDVKPLFEQNGIQVDLSKRGIYKADVNPVIMLKNRMKLRIQLIKYEKKYYKHH